MEPRSRTPNADHVARNSLCVISFAETRPKERRTSCSRFLYGRICPQRRFAASKFLMCCFSANVNVLFIMASKINCTGMCLKFSFGHCFVACTVRVLNGTDFRFLFVFLLSTNLLKWIPVALFRLFSLLTFVLAYII